MTDIQPSIPTVPEVWAGSKPSRWLGAAMVCALVLGPFGHGQALAADQTATACPAAHTPVAGPVLFVTATNARRVAGNITFTVYGENPARFLAHKGKLALIHVPLSSTQAVACFVVSAPGLYAVAIYHDENNNHRFDRTLIGLPEEGYGFSNNARIFFGPPSLKSVQFAVGPGQTHIAIELRY